MDENANVPVGSAAEPIPVAAAGHVVKPRLPGEKTFALLMLLCGLTVLWLSYRISGFSGWSTAGSVPLGTSLVLSLAALRILFSTLQKPAEPAGPGEPIWHQFYTRIFPARHFVFTGVIILYMVTLEPLGFLLSSLIYMTLSSLALGERRYVWMTAVNVLTLAAVYLVFQTAFSVVLPVGPIERIFR
jgi:putative tricarboxylic transport membrane protein